MTAAEPTAFPGGWLAEAERQWTRRETALRAALDELALWRALAPLLPYAVPVPRRRPRRLR
ncbi:hypothetical protein [Pseudonocardia asaccharolytica]|uniref:Uncharacterized protein n=1 Tax=Pseudonocardia asaccharolytica DSM 44247 = NBRC 16224 TaxID=1123024 RepID=A0A511CYR9_9PSEU|nr:hypothetical protein [Pseudonocardia asaccharolytica]GEL17702.1 hypothetical protein PA7_15390 [Pseudonocardia asaccharolytica DSM 44247 = NBRC 16224]